MAKQVLNNLMTGLAFRTILNENFTELYDLAGASTELVPVTRTNNPISASDTLAENIDNLDEAIGAEADLTIVTRAVGQIVSDSSLLKKIDALDEVVGFDAQVSGTPKNISKAQTIYQNLDALDTYKTVQTKKFTIGGVGVAGCDFNFTTAEDMTEQVIDLGAILPAFSRLIDVFTVTNTAFTDAVSLGIEIGTTSGGDELAATADVIAANAINQIAHANTFPAISATESHLYINGTPGANWNLVTAGKLTVYVTYNNILNV